MEKACIHTHTKRSDMSSMSLQNLYCSANKNTAAIWAENAGIGEVKQRKYYAPMKLALASGIQPLVSFDVSRLIGERQALNFGDVAGELKLARVNYNWTTCCPLTN